MEASGTFDTSMRTSTIRARMRTVMRCVGPCLPVFSITVLQSPRRLRTDGSWLSSITPDSRRDGYQRWNIDLALGLPSGSPKPPRDGERIPFEVPTVIELAIEAKGVMTEHGKARHNRLRDLQAFHDRAHRYNEKVVAGGILVVNVAGVYWSPTRDEDDITDHHDIERIGEETVELFRNIHFGTIRRTRAEWKGWASWLCDTTISRRIPTCLPMHRPVRKRHWSRRPLLLRRAIR